MELSKITDLDMAGKRILLRADLDVDIAGHNDNFRLKALRSTLKYLSENKAKTIIIGHKGRPAGKVVPELSLGSVVKKLSELSGYKIEFSDEVIGGKTEAAVEKLQEGDFVCLENLRFDPGEENNTPDFAKALASLGDIYVNDAFASHQPHASIVDLPKLLPHAAGFRFVEEVKNLSVVFENPVKPVVFLFGGFKKDKLDYLEGIKKIADKILLGGRLPDYLGDAGLVSVRTRGKEEQVIIANLVMDKEDMTIHSIERFEQEIKQAKTIVLAGPMGKYEEEGHRQGTARVFQAVARAGESTFKIVGGGDTVAAVYLLGLEDKFNWISVGGGAMLEFLAKKTLPAIEALK